MLVDNKETFQHSIIAMACKGEEERFTTLEKEVDKLEDKISYMWASKNKTLKILNINEMMWQLIQSMT